MITNTDPTERDRIQKDMRENPNLYEDIKQLRVEPGLKYDAGKSRMDLVASEFVEGIGRIQAFGAAKYSERNWEKGMSWGRCFAALMRHCWAFWRGEELDPETGECHLLHAGTMLMYLYCYWTRKVGTDDRYIHPR